MNKKSYLDEHQEQVLLKIEHNGCWFAFWSLFIIMVIEAVICSLQGKNIAVVCGGEWLVFMCLATYLSATSVKNGIWDRKIKMNTATNLIVAAIGAVVGGAIQFIITWSRYPDKIFGSIAAGVFMAGVVFVLVFITLEISMASVRKKQAELEKEPEEEEI